MTPLFLHMKPPSSVTKVRHNLLTGIMELVIINVIFSSFPKIYSQLGSAGGTGHISQSNLPEKVPVSFRWTRQRGKKLEAEINATQAKILPRILHLAYCLNLYPSG